MSVLKQASTSTAGLVLVVLLLSAASADAADDCPWVVQAYVSEAVLKDGRAAYDITYDGESRASAFYGFSSASPQLSWRLIGSPGLPALEGGARPLERVETPVGATVYRLDPATVEPAVIYLMATSEPVAALEQIGARIDPARPLAVSQLGITRGGSDLSGALPRRSVPGIVIAEAIAAESAPSLTICAYQVAMR